MNERYWSDTEEDPDRKRRRQAEFLVHQQLPLNQLIGFGVFDNEMKKKVEVLLQAHHINKTVAIRPQFYY